MSPWTRLAFVSGILCALSLNGGCSSREWHVRHDGDLDRSPNSLTLDQPHLISESAAVSEPAESLPITTEPADAIELVSQPLTDTALIDRELTAFAETNTATTSTVWADDVQPAPFPEESGISIHELESIALENNPTIRQLSAIAYKAAGVRDQVGLYPNPTLAYSAQQLADAGTDQHMLVIDQEIVRGDKLWLNEQVLGAATLAQFRELEVQRFRVISDVRVRFYEALGAQRRYELAQEFETIAAQGVDIATQRMEALEGTRADILQAEILLDQVQLTRQQAEIAMQGAWADLAAIAGIPDWSNPGLIGQLEIDAPDEDWGARQAMLIACSPEMSAAAARVSAARANLERQEVQSIPNLLLEVGAGYDNGTNQGMVNVEIGAPLPLHNANEGNIRAAYGDYCSATHDVRRIEMSLRSRLARVAQEYDSALAAVRKYENDILPRAEQSLELSEQAYRAGETDFLQVLVVRRTAFDANVLYLESLTKLAQASAKLDGLLLTGGLDEPDDFEWDDDLRGQAFEGQ